MKKIVLLFLLWGVYTQSQIVKGIFNNAKATELVIMTFDGFDQKELAKTISDSAGHFSFKLSSPYTGAAVLKIKDAVTVLLMMNNEDFEIEYPNFDDVNSLQFYGSTENEIFGEAVNVNQEAEQKLSALKYLAGKYRIKSKQFKWLQEEIKVQKNELSQFVNTIPTGRYVKDYLVWQNFLIDMKLTLSQDEQLIRVQQHEQEFQKIDFNGLWNSGLMKDILTGFYDVLALYREESRISARCIEASKLCLKAFEKDPVKQQIVAEFCFRLLESRNLTRASEYIALSMLNQENCELSQRRLDLFEQYRKLGIGKTAPNIVFTAKSTGILANVEQLDSQYKLIVFGSSWCPTCQNDYPSLVGVYKQLKDKFDIEVVYVSLDTDRNSFDNYFKEAPFVTIYDGKGLESKVAADYHIFATPTYFLLDKNLKILAKIKSPHDLAAWLEQYGSY